VPESGLLLVTGSLYVVTEARTLLLGTTATP
jgi:folylpolyglutamate synthase/dihydropteroate synthase